MENINLDVAYFFSTRKDKYKNYENLQPTYWVQ